MVQRVLRLRPVTVIAERNGRVSIGLVLGPGVGDVEVEALAEAAIKRGHQRVIRGMSQVLKAAVGGYVVVLRIRPDRLAQGTDKRRIRRVKGLAVCRCGAAWRVNSVSVVVQVIAQREILRVEVIGVREETRMQVLRRLTNIAEGENQVLRHFIL